MQGVALFKEAVVSHRHFRMGVLLFLLFGVSFAYFTQGTHNANVLPRAALIVNMVQHGRVDINGYESLTVDKAFYDGNYYSDKSPGMSLLAAPVAYAFTRAFPVTAEAAARIDGLVWHAFVYLCTLSTSGLFSALAGVVLFHYLLQRTGDLRAALIGSLTFGLGTPIWGWATSFFSHAVTGALLVMGFIAIDSASRRVAAGERALAPAILSGLALGAAAAVEHTALVPCAVIGAAIAVVGPWRQDTAATLGMFAVAGFAALCAIAPVLVYYDAAFGSPFSLGYQYTVTFDAHRTGLFGIGQPNLALIGELVFGGRRGLLWISPVMLAAAWAVVVAARHRQTRMPAVVAALVLGGYLLMNSGFAYWLGGASTGPRYLTPGLGMMALPLGLAWRHFGTWERRGTLALLGVSMFLNLACTAVGMTAQEELTNPLTQHILPSFIAGQLDKTVTFKFAAPLGLLNLAPLLALWAVLGWLLWRETQRLSASPARA